MLEKLSWGDGDIWIMGEYCGPTKTNWNDLEGIMVYTQFSIRYILRKWTLWNLYEWIVAVCRGWVSAGSNTDNVSCDFMALWQILVGHEHPSLHHSSPFLRTFDWAEFF